MMYTMPKNLLSICVNFTLATQQIAEKEKKVLTGDTSPDIINLALRR